MMSTVYAASILVITFGTLLSLSSLQTLLLEWVVAFVPTGLQGNRHASAALQRLVRASVVRNWSTFLEFDPRV
jgi:hypothetical protein